MSFCLFFFIASITAPEAASVSGTRGGIPDKAHPEMLDGPRSWRCLLLRVLPAQNLRCENQGACYCFLLNSNTGTLVCKAYTQTSLQGPLLEQNQFCLQKIHFAIWKSALPVS